MGRKKNSQEEPIEEGFDNAQTQKLATQFFF
jgi:hypothetical protein